MRIHIDGDVVLHACANSSDRNARKACAEKGVPFEAEPVAHVLHSIKLSLNSIIEQFDEYVVYLSGAKETNFRYDVYPEYKNDRPPRPHHYQACREYMRSQYGAQIVRGEADDALGKEGAAAWTKAVEISTFFGQPEDPWYYLESTIGTVDKDLLMIPGLHYNWRKDETRRVDADDGWSLFCGQLLTGDSVDCIPGLKGVGTITALHILGTVNNPDQPRLLAEVVREYARRAVPLATLYRTADLIWIQRDARRGRQVLTDTLPDQDLVAIWSAATAEKPTKAPRKKRVAGVSNATD